MGQLVLPSAGPICVDTTAVIYHVERIEPYFSAAANLWSLVAARQLEVTVSELALLEVLVKPLQIGNHSLADLYRRVVTATAGINCRPIDSAVLEKAAAIRRNRSCERPMPSMLPLRYWRNAHVLLPMITVFVASLV